MRSATQYFKSLDGTWSSRSVPCPSQWLSLFSENIGVVTPSATISLATWVDNYYAFGVDIESAIAIAETFEEELHRTWDLKIKASSRSVISCCERQGDHDTAKWPVVSTMDVLGHLVSADASPWTCWRRTMMQMWAAFWKNCVGRQTVGLSLKQRCRMLNRSVRPILYSKNTRWPLACALADVHWGLQRKMLSCFD